MKFLLVSLCLWLGCVSIPADTLSDAALKDISLDQKLGDTVSLDLPFRDEGGREVELSQYFGRRPVILDLGYYGCPMLCTEVLNGLTGALQDLQWKMGTDYEVVNVSIDPSETSTLARQKKDSYVKRFGRPGAEEGWHFLTGDEPAIRKLCDETGFHYAYDRDSHQYAHASGLIFLSPRGRIIKYLPGVAYASADVQKALADSAAAKVGTPVEQLFLLCFHYNPLTGKYSHLILDGVRVFSLLLVAGLTFLVLSNLRRPRTARPKES